MQHPLSKRTVDSTRAPISPRASISTRAPTSTRASTSISSNETSNRAERSFDSTCLLVDSPRKDKRCRESSPVCSEERQFESQQPSAAAAAQLPPFVRHRKSEEIPRESCERERKRLGRSSDSISFAIPCQTIRRTDKSTATPDPQTSGGPNRSGGSPQRPLFLSSQLVDVEVERVLRLNRNPLEFINSPVGGLDERCRNCGTCDRCRSTSSQVIPQRPAIPTSLLATRTSPRSSNVFCSSVLTSSAPSDLSSSDFSNTRRRHSTSSSSSQHHCQSRQSHCQSHSHSFDHSVSPHRHRPIPFTSRVGNSSSSSSPAPVSSDFGSSYRGSSVITTPGTTPRRAPDGAEWRRCSRTDRIERDRIERSSQLNSMGAEFSSSSNRSDPQRTNSSSPNRMPTRTVHSNRRNLETRNIETRNSADQQLENSHHQCSPDRRVYHCSICGQSVSGNDREDHNLAHRLQSEETEEAAIAARRFFEDLMRVEDSDQPSASNGVELQFSLRTGRHPLFVLTPGEVSSNGSNSPGEPLSSNVDPFHELLRRLREGPSFAPLPPAPPLGTPQHVIDNLPISDFTPAEIGGSSRSDEETCMVCLDNYNSSDRIRRLPCLHAFHVGCIDEWLARSLLCPVCKVIVQLADSTDRSRSPQHGEKRTR